jgi:uncharacterized NAD(P)/FAD-binding protein YdhS
MFRIVRRHICRAHENGSDWRAVIDSLRPFTQKLWSNLPTQEKQYFRLHLSRYWNIARHRMPPEAFVILERMKASGQLEILKGRLAEIRHNGRFTIAFHNREKRSTVSADTIVNCIGSETDFAKIESPLVKNLLRRGLVECDELRLGLNATPDGHIIGQDKKPSNILFTLGTPLRGILWETTAIPEIRQQARELASKLLSMPPRQQ